MKRHVVSRTLAVAAIAASMLAIPAESQAIFHWFGSGCSSCGSAPATAYRPAAVTYAPTYAVAPACSSCNTCGYAPTCQTCNYVPQTCYRTVYQQVPVTSYQPVAACDACGNRTTALRPVTSYVTQARLVPYTTYQPTYTPTVSYAPAATYVPAASGCPTGNCGSGVTYASPVSTASPSCCGSSTPTYSTPSYTSPATSYPSATTGIPGSTVPSLAPTPAMPSSPSVRTPSTFREDSSVTTPTEEERLRPIPNPDYQGSQSTKPESNNAKTNSTLTPKLLDGQDRTTLRSAPRNFTVIPVSVEEPVDNDGWRAARR